MAATGRWLHRAKRIGIVTTAVIATSVAAREYRRSKRLGPGFDRATTRAELVVLLDAAQRIDLMRSFQGVGGELDNIERWHRSQGHHGGVVLRDLRENAWSPSNGDRSIAADDKAMPVPVPVPEVAVGGAGLLDEMLDERVLSNRECYFCYYEIKPNGHMRQQVFIRGSTTRDDWLGNLLANSEFDDELGLWLHAGIRKKANALVSDLETLLATGARSSVELAGHSLGGALALVCGLKLAHRGHRVVRISTFGSPKPLDSPTLIPDLGLGVIPFFRDACIWLLGPPRGVSCADLLAAADPPIAVVRVENERDFVPTLPAGSADCCGDRLLLPTPPPPPGPSPGCQHAALQDGPSPAPATSTSPSPSPSPSASPSSSSSSSPPLPSTSAAATDPPLPALPVPPLPPPTGQGRAVFTTAAASQQHWWLESPALSFLSVVPEAVLHAVELRASAAGPHPHLIGAYAAALERLCAGVDVVVPYDARYDRPP